MKNCSNPKCGILKPLTEYHKDKSSRDGFRSRCKSCCNSYYPEHKDKMLESQKKYVENNKESFTEYQASHYKKNKEKIKPKRAKFRENNRDHFENQRKAWKSENRGRLNALNAKREMAKINATPPWLTEEHFCQIEEFYIKAAQLTKETGIPHQVDHILPLQGKNVRGLHVPWNLQILTASENASKGNRIVSN